MIKNIIFDFGKVLVDWDPHHLYDSYFGDVDSAEWFLKNICTMDWNVQMDAGKPFQQGIEEKITEEIKKLDIDFLMLEKAQTDYKNTI